MIGEPLADDTGQELVGALGVIDAERHTIAVPEIELGQIPIQVVMAAMLIDTLHATFEDREKALDGVGMDSAIQAGNVLAVHVLDDTVTGEILAQVVILVRLVGHYPGFARDILSQDRDKSHGFKVVHNQTARASGAAVYEGQHLVLVLITASFLRALGLLGAVVTDKGFVHFDGAAALPEYFKAIRLHRLADAVPHEPRGFEGHAEGAVQLVGADALLAGCDQEDGLQPKAQRNMARLEDGPNLHGKRLTAVIALVGAYAGALADHLADSLKTAAMRANGTIWPDARFYKLICRFFIMEVQCGEDGLGHIGSLECSKHTVNI